MKLCCSVGADKGFTPELSPALVTLPTHVQLRNIRKKRTWTVSKRRRKMPPSSLPHSRKARWWLGFNRGPMLPSSSGVSFGLGSFWISRNLFHHFKSDKRGNTACAGWQCINSWTVEGIAFRLFACRCTPLQVWQACDGKKYDEAGYSSSCDKGLHP